VVVEDRVRSGWCPRHDRTFETSDGVCPECGTALVDLGRMRDEPRVVVPEEEPPAGFVEPIAIEARDKEASNGETFRVGTPVLAAGVIGIVLVAFLFGLAFPRSRGEKSTSQPTPQARVDYQIGRERTDAGVRLRLDSLAQRGKRVVLRVTVPNQPAIAIGRIVSVTVAPEVASGLVLEGVTLEVRHTISGFIADGPVLERDDIAIIGIRLLRVDISADGRGRADLDLSPVWPDRPRGPIASDRVTRLSFAGRNMRVVGLVGWPDHLEVQIEELGVPEGWAHGDVFRILPGGAPADGEVVREGINGPSRLTTVAFQACREPAFQCVPRGISRVTLIVDPSSTTINGRWAWEFG
jgi:hypothetical protein